MPVQAVSFKWLARHLSVPANDAKRLLFEFSEKYRSKLSSTYLVAGWTKGASPQHVVQLVDASAVADKRSKLDPVTSLHVYSIQPTAPKVRTAPLLSWTL
jgi:DNA polymerase delta subunit 3